MKRIRIYSHIIIFICYLLISCSTNDDPIPPSSGPIQVAITVTLPEQEEVLSRAYTDKDIKNITVLVFDESSKFMERIDVDEADITTDASGIKFNIVIDATPNNRTLHLIANARTADGTVERIDLSGLTTTRTEAQTIPSLTTMAIIGTDANTLINNITPLIMWGRVTLNGINVTTKVDDVKLLRSVACVQVKKDVATFTNGLDNLTISGMAIHNGNDRGYVTTSAYNSDVTSNPLTGNPYTASTCDYARAWTTGADPVAYIYERNSTGNDYMSVIIEAKYNGQVGFYKVALVQNDTPINIIRNHRYTITILSVNGAGYGTAAMAASSAPSNALKVAITDANEDFPCIKADSQHWMGLSCNVFHLIGQTSGANQTANVELCQVYSSRGIAPTVKVGNTAALSVSVQPLGGNKYKVLGTFNHANFNGNSLTIQCDNLSLTLGVICSTIAAVSDLREDTDSYAFSAVGSLRNWRAWIPNPSTNNYIHLHPSDGDPGLLSANSGNGMVTELTGKYGGGAYVHIHKGTNRQDEFYTTAYSSNAIVVRKTVIAQ